MLLAQFRIALPEIVAGVRLIAFFISGGSSSDRDHASALAPSTIVFLQFEYRVAELGSRKGSGPNERVT